MNPGHLRAEVALVAGAPLVLGTQAGLLSLRAQAWGQPANTPAPISFDEWRITALDCP